LLQAGRDNFVVRSLVAHAVLAVMFFRLTTGQALGRIWWGLEIVLLAALTAVISVPGVRKLTHHLNSSHSDSLDSRPGREPDSIELPWVENKRIRASVGRPR
jgi:hypothetical protein